MSAMNVEQPTDIICFCSGTTETQLKNLLAKGVDDVEELENLTGVNTGCGGCEENLVTFLAQYRVES